MEPTEFLIRSAFSWPGLKAAEVFLSVFKKKKVALVQAGIPSNPNELAVRGTDDDALAKRVLDIIRREHLEDDPEIQALLQEANSAPASKTIHVQAENVGNLIDGNTGPVNITQTFGSKS